MILRKRARARNGRLSSVGARFIKVMAKFGEREKKTRLESGDETRALQTCSLRVGIYIASTQDAISLSGSTSGPTRTLRNWCAIARAVGSCKRHARARDTGVGPNSLLLCERLQTHTSRECVRATKSGSLLLSAQHTKCRHGEAFAGRTHRQTSTFHQHEPPQKMSTQLADAPHNRATLHALECDASAPGEHGPWRLDKS